MVPLLRGECFDYRVNATVGDEMFLNAAFLVGKGRDKEVDNIVEDISDAYKDRASFTYVGPLPPYNFVNLVIYPEAWET